MKIRTIQIKNYKMFKDVTLDFTNRDGDTLDTVVIAGLNGSGKTSLLQLLQRLFSESLNLFKVGSLLHKYEVEKNALICDEIALELDLSDDEKSRLISLAHQLTAKINKSVGNQNEIMRALEQLEKRLNTQARYIKLSYQLQKTEKGFFLSQNDFAYLCLCCR
jgi:predicted ATP-dependent endonuclease of OLD family